MLRSQERVGRAAGTPHALAVTIALIVGLLASLPGHAVSAAAPRGPAAVSDPKAPAISWHPCKSAPSLDCGRLKVPLDYDRPSGAQISIAVLRQPAREPANRIGSLVLNPGGPGGSGVSFVQFGGRTLLTPAIRKRFDLVGFDPRGVGRSATLECYQTAGAAFRALPPFAFPLRPHQERRWLDDHRAYSNRCGSHATPIIDHMSSANVARDIDRLRQALGDDQLTFAGYSYGTVIGEQYANLFPNNVRAIVIDGVIDPVEYTTGVGDEAETLPIDARIKSEQGAYESLQAFWELCDAGGKRCAFSRGNPQARYEALADRLKERPAKLPDGKGGTDPYGYQDLVATSLSSMYSSSSWPFFAQFLRQLDRRTDLSKAGRDLRRLDVRLGLSGRAPSAQVLEGFAGVWCLDGLNPSYELAWRDAARAADQAWPYFGRIWNWSSAICATWPGEDGDRYLGPFDVPTSNDVLVVGSRRDPATRYQDAVTTAATLDRGVLLTVNGWGHTSLGQSACADQLIAHYLLTGDAPPSGTECEPDVIPFSPGGQRATTGRDAAFVIGTSLGARLGSWR